MSYNRKTIIQFKTGAFVSGNPVLPCAYFMMIVHWILIKNWQFINFVTIHVLPVYIPKDNEKPVEDGEKNSGLDEMQVKEINRENIRRYANNVRNVIAHKLNIPVTQHTFDDLMLSYLSKNNDENNNNECIFDLNNIIINDINVQLKISSKSVVLLAKWFFANCSNRYIIIMFVLLITITKKKEI